MPSKINSYLILSWPTFTNYNLLKSLSNMKEQSYTARLADLQCRQPDSFRQSELGI